MSFEPSFTVTHSITADLMRIERARGFLEAATLSEHWIREMSARALVLEAHHTTHIEGARLTVEESEVLFAGEMVPEADPDDVRDLVNYRNAFEFVSIWLGSGGPVTVENGRSSGTPSCGSTRCRSGRQPHLVTLSSVAASRFTTTKALPRSEPADAAAGHEGACRKGAALLRRMLSHSFIMSYAHGHPFVVRLWPGAASGKRLDPLLSAPVPA